MYFVRQKLKPVFRCLRGGLAYTLACQEEFRELRTTSGKRNLKMNKVANLDSVVWATHKVKIGILQQKNYVKLNSIRRAAITLLPCMNV